MGCQSMPPKGGVKRKDSAPDDEQPAEKKGKKEHDVEADKEKKSKKDKKEKKEKVGTDDKKDKKDKTDKKDKKEKDTTTDAKKEALDSNGHNDELEAASPKTDQNEKKD